MTGQQQFSEVKKNNISAIIVATCLLLAGASCVRQEMEASFDADDNLERVPVTLSVDVSQIEDGTPGTKAIQEPDVSGVTSDSQIKDFVVLQFNGTTASAQLVGGQIYFDHWPLNGYRPTTDPLYDKNDVLSLVASSSANTVVVLANTFGPVAINAATTLGEFLANDYTTISGLSGVLTTAGGNDYLRFSGSKKLNSVSLGDNVSISLKRNVAKIVVNVTNLTHKNGSTGDDIVTISNAHLRDINGKYYYLTHVDAALDPVTFTDPYTPTYPYRFDNATEEFPAAKNNSGDTETYTYYVPANLRGTNSSTSQSTKSYGAPEGATYFCLYGTYGTSNTPIVYTYYLGGNLTNDFNLRPNYKYTYNITIKSKGNADYDSRIDDLKEIQFSTDANCYMVHPPKLEGQTKVYSFPVRRAAVFWNTEAQGGLYGANSVEGYGAYVLDGSTQWEPVIIWSDFDMSAYMSGASKFLAVDSGTGFDPSNHTQPYLKVRISHGMSGNVIVGMKSNGDILWSWHIWITDYNPDIPMTPVAHQYIYGVPGGEIHRYNNTLWNTTPTESVTGYANGFAMDRNLGALDTKYGANHGNGLYYQFGRKDPFAANATFWLSGTTEANVLDGNRAILNANVPGTDGKNIRYTVMHPEVFITANGTNPNFTVTGDDMGDGGSKNYLWNDKKYLTDAGQRHEPKKSIYDPCPPGWKVPIKDNWAGFNYETSSNSAAQTYTTVWADTGRYYYPEGYVNRDATGSIFFPAAGYRSYGSGSFAYSGSYGYFFSSTAHSSANAWYMYFGDLTSSSKVVPATNSYRTTGYSVRCVRE